MPLNFITTWETPKGNKKITTNDPLIIGDQITQQLVRKSVTSVLNQVLPQSVNFGARQAINYMKICARLFQRLVARTPMDETYKYIKLYDDEGNLNPHYELHRPDNDSVRADWEMMVNVGGCYAIVKATDFDMTIFKVVDDDYAVKTIYNFLKGKIDYKKVKINVTEEGIDTQLSVKFTNKNSHFNKLEYGGYSKDSWHKPYEGSFYFHGAYNGFSAMAPAGFFRKTMAEKEMAFKMSEEKGILVTQALKRVCLKEINEAEMQNYYNDITIAGYKTIKELADNKVKTDFRKMNINKLYEYAIKEVGLLEDIEIARGIPADKANTSDEFMYYMYNNYGKTSTEAKRLLERLIRKYGVTEKNALAKLTSEWDRFASQVSSKINDEEFFDEIWRRVWTGPVSKRKFLDTRGRQKAKKELTQKAESAFEKWTMRGRVKYLRDDVRKSYTELNKRRNTIKPKIKKSDLIHISSYTPKYKRSKVTEDNLKNIDVARKPDVTVRRLIKKGNDFTLGPQVRIYKKRRR